MRAMLFVALVIGGSSLMSSEPAHAVGIRHPFCLQGEEYPGLSYCTFDTYAQCQATASGRLLQCIANPYFAGVSDDPRATPYPYPQRQRIRSRPPAPNPFAPLPNLFEFRED
jgi:Protein of unknown function (DUF3551)